MSEFTHTSSLIPFPYSLSLRSRFIARHATKLQKRTGSNRRGLFVLTLTGFLACLLCAFLGAQAAAPFMDAATLARANDAVAAQVKRLQLQNQRDERAIALAKTNAGIERKARASGWMRPEERRFRIPQSAPSGK